jgi:hypothetical protein
MTENEILLVLTGQNDQQAEDAAFRYAAQTAKGLVVLQILTSNLYHYGHHDVIATRPSKLQFLFHIREEVLEKGRAKAEVLKERAREQSIPIEIRMVETEDAPSIVLSEARKGFDSIFIGKEKKRFFPLFGKTMAERLERECPIRVVQC